MEHMLLYLVKPCGLLYQSRHVVIASFFWTIVCKRGLFALQPLLTICSCASCNVRFAPIDRVSSWLGRMQGTVEDYNKSFKPQDN